MNGVNIGTFDSSIPADTESLGQSDDRMRSIKTTMQQVLDDEHSFPAAGGSVVGFHRFGSARPYFGPQSTVSSSGTDGRMQIASDTSRLFGVGSAGTVLLGAGPLALSVGTTVGISFPQRHYWAEEFGASITPSSGSVVVSIPNSGFSGQPFTFASVYTTTVAPLAAYVTIQPIDGASFVIGATNGTSNLSGVPFFWRSIGTRVL